MPQVELGKCAYEKGSDAKMLTFLTTPAVTSYVHTHVHTHCLTHSGEIAAWGFVAAGTQLEV